VLIVEAGEIPQGLQRQRAAAPKAPRFLQQRHLTVVADALPPWSSIHDGLRNPAEQIFDQRRENGPYEQAVSQYRLQS